MGMQLMDHTLVNLHKTGMIDTDKVYACRNDPEEVEMLIASTDDRNKFKILKMITPQVIMLIPKERKDRPQDVFTGYQPPF
jgi:hypothetical protein